MSAAVVIDVRKRKPQADGSEWRAIVQVGSHVAIGWLDTRNQAVKWANLAKADVMAAHLKAEAPKCR